VLNPPDAGPAEIRPARLADLPAVERLVAEAYVEYEEIGRETIEGRHAVWMRRRLRTVAIPRAGRALVGGGVRSIRAAAP
jgi:hypothetical protein